jgi:hypothetical protein
MWKHAPENVIFVCEMMLERGQIAQDRDDEGHIPQHLEAIRSPQSCVSGASGIVC